MDTCPYCETVIAYELNFCIECERQVKCLACGGLLFKDKTRCLRCGELLKADDLQTNSGSTNSYTLEEKTTETSTYRRIELVASDNAVDAFASRLPLGNIAPLRTVEGEFRATQDSRLLTEPQSDNYLDVVDDEVNRDSDASEQTQVSDNSSIEIGALFSDHSQFEIIPSKTLRDYIQGQSTKKARQQKFAILYVWGFNERTGRNITRSELIAIMQHEDLHDGNTWKHLGSVINDYFVVNGNNYRINDYDGRAEIDMILDEIRNPKPKDQGQEVKSNKIGRPSGSSNKKELETINPWLEMSINLPASFDVRRLGSATDWTLFAIYVLTKLLKVEDTVEPGVAYAYISKKYPTLSVKRKTFRDSLSRDKSNVLRSVSGGYSLTQIGEEKIKKLIANS